jgi:hypothetical protein
MGLQDERGALDRRGVSAFAALGETLFDEPLRLGEQCDALAGVTLAAGIVGEAFAVCSLRKDARQRVFANALRAGKEQRMWHAPGA